VADDEFTRTANRPQQKLVLSALFPKFAVLLVIYDVGVATEVAPSFAEVPDSNTLS
jgi:hypothetical protein